MRREGLTRHDGQRSAADEQLALPIGDGRARHGYARRARGLGPARLARRLLAILCALAGALLLWSASASALSQRGHEFAFSFNEGISTPSAVAVDEHRSPEEGNVYVADVGSESVKRFKCSTEKCELDPTFEPKIKGEPEYIAIDNSPTSPSKGDLYVGYEEKRVEKFDPSKCILKPKTEECSGKFGEKVQKFETYKLKGESAEEIGEIHGLAVDTEGNFYLYQAENIVKFDNLEKVKATEIVEPFFECGEPKQGFAVAPKGEAFYVGHVLETRSPEVCVAEETTAIGKLDSAGTLVTGALDRQESTAAAVDLSDIVYVDNVTSIAAFEPHENGALTLIQRFTSEGLTRGRGLAVDSATGEVYVADSGAHAIAVFGPEKAAAPTVDSESAENLSPTEEELNAQIDPKGDATQYHFEYGTEKCTESTCTATPSGAIPAGFGAEKVEVKLSGLQPGTRYYFRVVAKNKFGEAEGAGSFETLPSSLETLADNRAWELVSPPEKSGASIFPILFDEGLIQASTDGSAIAYIADSPVEGNPEGNRAFEVSQTIAHRGTEAWASRTIAIGTERAEGRRGEGDYWFFSPDLSLSLLEPQPRKSGEALEHPPLSPNATERTLYLRNEAACGDPSTCFEPLVTAKNVTAEHGGVKSKFGAQLGFYQASPDLQHVVFESGVALTANAGESEQQPGVYEWNADSPLQLQLVSALPSATEPSCGGLSCKPAVDVASRFSENARNAVSTDGSRVVWTGQAPPVKVGEVEVEQVRRLYMRDTSTDETVQIDRAQGVPEHEVEVEDEFQAASSDGTKVFFTTPVRLTPESTLGEEAEENKENDLYVCEAPRGSEKLGCTLKDLSIGAHGESAAVQGVLGASEDGSSIYFVADGVLGETEREGATPGTCAEGVPFGTECNLYAEHFNPQKGEKGEWEAPVFIARLSVADGSDWNPALRTGFFGQLRALTSRVSPNGRYVAFMSESPLTGYDNRDTNPAAKGARDEEVFLYDASAHRITCVSCNPSGAPPRGVFDTGEGGEGLGLLVDRARNWDGHWIAGSIPGWSPVDQNHSFYQSRYLSDEGRLFFNSADALVSEDTNHRLETVPGEPNPVEVGVEDVYEYEPAGVGGCQKEGCVALISSGKDAQESAFVDASVSGDDAFFVTGHPLVAADKDTNYDLYDARVCTAASPCITSESSSVRSCEDEHTCKPNPPESPQPGFGAPLSSTFTGPGNTHREETRGAPVSKPKHKLTRAQKLKKALKACHKKHNKKKRKACERRARKKYGLKHASKHARKGKR